MNKFNLNDRVQWTNPGPNNKAGTSHSGNVVAVVERRKRPDSRLYPAFVKGRQTGVRNEESYLVLDDGGKYHWPLASRLSLMPVQANPAPAVIDVPVTDTVQTTSVATAPDGTVTTTVTTHSYKTEADGSVTKTVTQTVTTKPPVEQSIDTDYIIGLDSSGSMQSIRAATVEAVNTQIRAIREASSRAGMKPPRVSLYTFGDSRTTTKIFREPVNSLKDLTLADFLPTGNTPMVRCLADILGKFSTLPDILNNPNHSMFLSIVTDGEDTQGDYTGNPTPKLVKTANDTGRWTMTFMLPPGHRSRFMSKWGNLGVSSDNILEWEASARGVYQAATVAVNSLGTYALARSAGVRSVNNFYVQPNLAHVSQTDLNSLTDLSGTYRVYTVDQESRIDDFVAGKTGSEYVIGSAFYQLTKKEKKVQSTKGVLLRDKFTKKIYGGDQARAIIGLPKGVDATVDPGNHGNFDIFVESTSVNRILPRGSIVLHDFRMTTAKTPTWVASVATLPTPPRA